MIINLVVFLFPLWGDEISPEGGFRPSGKEGYASHKGVVFNSIEGFQSGNYNTLIITDGGNAIPHSWGNTSQYLSRFAQYFYENNADGQTYFFQSWPYIIDGDVSDWREKIDLYLPRWHQVTNTVNGYITPSYENGNLYYIPKHERLSEQASKVKLLPAGLALAKVYDNYKKGITPENGRDFVNELFKNTRLFNKFRY